MSIHLKNTFIALLLLAVLLSQFVSVPQTARAAACDAALFVADVTVPDDTVFPPVTTFIKTWRLKNVGTCTWTTSYKLVFSGGTSFSGQEEIPLPSDVAPGASTDLSISLVTMAGNGTYRGYWQLKNAAGARFGIGPAADKFFWVEIVVRGGIVKSTPTSRSDAMSDDFATSGFAANWLSGAGTLYFPGAEGEVRGFVYKLDSVQLETGVTVNQPTLLMVPQNKTDGYIQGFFPALTIQNGDRFQTTVGCQYGATSCYVTYRIDYRTSAGVKTLWTFRERYDGLTYNVNLDLSFLAGKSPEFFLMVLASGSPSGDRALWVAPRIVRAGVPGNPTATATAQLPPTNTPLSSTAVPVTLIPPTLMPPTGTGDDLTANGGAASWLSGAGALPFPGADGDSRGFALKLDSVQLETGAFANGPSLLMAPQNKADGYIQGLFPALTIQNGDRFQTTIGCQYGATSCYVTYRIDYRTSAGVKTLWTFRERYDGLTYNVNLDLSFLAGKSTQFFLLVLASGPASGDRALWVAPRIVHVGGPGPATNTPMFTPTATTTPFPTATITPPPVHANWSMYTNPTYQFQIQYPPEGQVGSLTDGTIRITLPFTPNTNLGEKYLDVNMAPNATVCTSPLTSGYAPGSFSSTPVSINGIAFIKESGSDAGAGNIHQWTAYSTLKGSICVSLSFVLHSTNPGNYPTPPPVFDQNAESAVFEEMVSTFGWVGP